MTSGLGQSVFLQVWHLVDKPGPNSQMMDYYIIKKAQSGWILEEFRGGTESRYNQTTFYGILKELTKYF